MDKETLSRIRNEYVAERERLKRFSAELAAQLMSLLEPNKANMAVPVSFRVKEWDSIQEKLEQRLQDATSLRDVKDVVGLRIIMLFQRDIISVDKLIVKNFVIHERENTRERLGDAEFGYSSIHYIISLRKKWLKAPTLASYNGLLAELQLRTAAEHTWAATSHVLQYKSQLDIPPGVRRAMSRTSALLETVDLELERVLIERAAYQKLIPTDSTSEVLNVALIEKVLDELLPQKNKAKQELYGELLEDLRHFGITTPKQLRDLLLEQGANMLRDEGLSLEELRHDTNLPPDLKEDLKRGAYFSHIGLVRVALRHAFGEAWAEYADKTLTNG
jgi:putative GTP pyrophosphokinase